MHCGDNKLLSTAYQRFTNKASPYRPLQKNHVRQSAQAQLAGGAKLYLKKQILILKSVCHIRQGQHQRLKQKSGDSH